MIYLQPYGNGEKSRFESGVVHPARHLVRGPWWVPAVMILTPLTLRLVVETRQFADLVGQYIIRGFAAIYDRNITRLDASALRNYVKKYLGVQVRGFTYHICHLIRLT